MEYVRLGSTGLKVSPLCMGSMQFGWTADEETSYSILNAAYRAGINFIDTANVYSRWVPGNPGGVSEEIIGRWMKKFQIPRASMVIATKVRGPMGEGPNDKGLSRVHILREVDQSLRRLQTDYIDLYQTHYFDEQTPIEETLSTLDDLVRQGKVRYVGCSNYPVWRLMQALWVSDRQNLVRYDSLQPHYNLVHRQEFELELEEVCLNYGLGVIPYSPLAGGFLTGKYRPEKEGVESARAGGAARYFNDRNWVLLNRMEEMGSQLGERSISQMALAWLIKRPSITSPIIGPRNLEQLEDNLGALGFDIPNELADELDRESDWRTQ